MYFDTMYQIEGMNIVANSLTWTSFDTFNDNKRVARKSTNLHFNSFFASQKHRGQWKKDTTKTNSY